MRDGRDESTDEGDAIPPAAAAGVSATSVSATSVSATPEPTPEPTSEQLGDGSCRGGGGEKRKPPSEKLERESGDGLAPPEPPTCTGTSEDCTRSVGLGGSALLAQHVSEREAAAAPAGLLAVFASAQLLPAQRLPAQPLSAARLDFAARGFGVAELRGLPQSLPGWTHMPPEESAGETSISSAGTRMTGEAPGGGAVTLNAGGAATLNAGATGTAALGVRRAAPGDASPWVGSLLVGDSLVLIDAVAGDAVDGDAMQQGDAR